MTAIDPNKVHFTGENSFLRLKDRGRGAGDHRLRPLAHADLAGRPRHLPLPPFRRDRRRGQALCRQHRDGALVAGRAGGDAEPALRRHGDADRRGRVLAGGCLPRNLSRDRRLGRRPDRVELVGHGRALPCCALPPDNDDTGPWAVYSCLIPCRTATLEVAGTRAQGAAYENVMFEHPASSSCLAWSETWLRG